MSLLKLLTFLDKYKHLASQTDEETWKSQRGKTSTSMIPSILKMNEKYSPEHVTMGRQIGLPEFQLSRDKIELMWGKLFEFVAIRYEEIKYGIKIYQTGSIPHLYDEKGELLFSCSPDGIGILNSKITLFEFKCPFRRKPNGKIPGHYMPQILGGADVVNVSEQAMFVDVLIRKCPYEQFDFSKTACNSLHDFSVVSNKEPLAIGVIIITDPCRKNEPVSNKKWDNYVRKLYDLHLKDRPSANKRLLLYTVVRSLCEEPQPVTLNYAITFLADLTKNHQAIVEAALIMGDFQTIVNEKWIDFGGVKEKEIFTTIHRYNAHYSRPLFADNMDLTPNQLFSAIQHDTLKTSEKIIGFLCWKIFDVKEVLVPKQAGYIETIKPELVRYAKIYDSIMELPAEMRRSAWEEHYGLSSTASGKSIDH